MMGLEGWLHWAAWFLKYLLFMLINAVMMTVIYTIELDFGAVLNYTEPSVLFVFFVAYVSTLIWFAFAISVFFAKGMLQNLVVSRYFLNGFAMFLQRTRRQLEQGSYFGWLTFPTFSSIKTTKVCRFLRKSSLLSLRTLQAVSSAECWRARNREVK